MCTQVIRHLLHCHAQMDPLDCQGNTPLHLAAASNQAEACQVSFMKQYYYARLGVYCGNVWFYEVYYIFF